MPYQFADIEALIQRNQVISESQLVFYVSALATQLREARAQAPDKAKPYTIIWYDHDKGCSCMIHTHAENSIEALSRHQNELPLMCNVSAYPNHLPSTLRYMPDILLESA